MNTIVALGIMIAGIGAIMLGISGNYSAVLKDLGITLPGATERAIPIQWGTNKQTPQTSGGMAGNQGGTIYGI